MPGPEFWSNALGVLLANLITVGFLWGIYCLRRADQGEMKAKPRSAVAIWLVILPFALLGLGYLVAGPFDSTYASGVADRGNGGAQIVAPENLY